MKWYGLFKKIGNQELNKMKKYDVYVLFEGKEIPLLLKFRADGSPYLVPKVVKL